MLRSCSNSLEIADPNCNTAEMNWENLKYLLALHRTGSLSAAAKRMSVDATTVSRRLTALQDEVGACLLEKAADGSVELTSAGVKAAEHAERAEASISGLTEELSGARLIEEGSVRISSVPFMINRILMPHLKHFTELHPGIELHLASEVRNVSLTKRETDMALRLGRPREGGHNVKAKRIAVLKHAVYASASNQDQNLPWITYHESTEFLPQARWMAANVPAGERQVSNIRPSDLEGVTEAVAAGLGKSVLPIVLAEGDSRLRRLSRPNPDLLREVWLLQHADQIALARMLAVSRWLENLFSAGTAERGC
ncbi:LysR family transcriptional regulator [Roseibium sp. SCP14]|uniref:LysR family transcriptional regulator n=1 Tax=Roseibium sp. SCP14 TaxID=3141375 RepID=UPI00333981CA